VELLLAGCEEGSYWLRRPPCVRACIDCSKMFWSIRRAGRRVSPARWKCKGSVHARRNECWSHRLPLLDDDDTCVVACRCGATGTPLRSQIKSEKGLRAQRFPAGATQRSKVNALRSRVQERAHRQGSLPPQLRTAEQRGKRVRRSCPGVHASAARAALRRIQCGYFLWWAAEAADPQRREAAVPMRSARHNMRAVPGRLWGAEIGPWRWAAQGRDGQRVQRMWEGRSLAWQP
jgi:hypothetical protein